jgi:tetratricopeptide (TPR) repeat protein
VALAPTQLDQIEPDGLGELHIDIETGADDGEELGLLAGFQHPAGGGVGNAEDADELAGAELPLLDAFEPGAALTDAEEAEAPEIAPLEGFESTLHEPAEPSLLPSEPEPLPMLEPTPAGPDEADEADEPEPSLSLEAPIDLDAFEAEPADDAVPVEEPAPAADALDDALPLLGFDDDEPAVVSPATADEPLLDSLDSAIGSAAGDVLDELRDALTRTPADVVGRAALVEVLFERGRGAEVEALLEETHRSLAAEDRFADAVAVLRSLIALRGDDLALYQKQVEYAFRASDRTLLVGAYLALAARMQAEGNAEKARAIYERVLELDAENETARAALAPKPGAARKGRASGADADYVDLAALIFDDEDEETGEPSTRFVVPEEEPTGDEARDFADMLAVFKQKVAANIDATDSTSHYDLGLAFKDMGLLDEAIAQFQVALRGGANPLATLEVLGECFVEKSQPTLGTRVLERALRLPGASEASLIGVHYWLGRCAEALDDDGAAADHYERAVALDIRFRDAAARLATLREAPAGAAFDKGQRAG